MNDPTISDFVLPVLAICAGLVTLQGIVWLHSWLFDDPEEFPEDDQR